MPSDESNFFTELIESLPTEREREQARSSFLVGFGRMLRAEDVARKRGEDPVRFALARLDLSAAPYDFRVEQAPFERGKLTFTWWPNGTKDRWVLEHPEPMAEFTSFTSALFSAKRRLIKAECRRVNYEFSRSFVENEELTIKTLAALIEREVGFRPPLLSGDAAYQKLTGSQPGPLRR